MESYKIVDGLLCSPALCTQAELDLAKSAADQTGSSVVAISLDSLDDDRVALCLVLRQGDWCGKLKEFLAQLNKLRKSGGALILPIFNSQGTGDRESTQAALLSCFGFVLAAYLVKRRSLGAKQAMLLLQKRTQEQLELSDDVVACVEQWSKFSNPSLTDLNVPACMRMPIVLATAGVLHRQSFAEVEGGDSESDSASDGKDDSPAMTEFSATAMLEEQEKINVAETERKANASIPSLPISPNSEVAAKSDSVKMLSVSPRSAPRQSLGVLEGSLVAAPAFKDAMEALSPAKDASEDGVETITTNDAEKSGSSESGLVTNLHSSAPVFGQRVDTDEEDEEDASSSGTKSESEKRVLKSQSQPMIARAAPSKQPTPAPKSEELASSPNKRSLMSSSNGLKKPNRSNSFLFGLKQKITMRKEKKATPSNPRASEEEPVAIPRGSIDEKRTRREVVDVVVFSDLPADDQKLVSEAELESGDCETHLFILLNVLHFHTKKIYRLRNTETGELRSTAGDREEVPFDFAKAEIELLSHEDPQKLYKLGPEVGKGGFGSVYEATGTKNKRQLVACKILPHDRPKDKRSNLQEVRCLRLFPHPNIVKYQEAFKVNNRSGSDMWMIMELMRGGTLTDAVKTHNFTEPQIAYVAQEMLFGIRHLHRHNLVHRDLKSGNVMLTVDGQVKLIDFGLCCDISDGEQIHMVGSPFWIPPEMVRCEPHGFPADIWSFGICVLELANNVIPNRRNSIFAMFHNTIYGFADPFPKTEYSPLFLEFMAGVLNIDQSKRLSSKDLRDHAFCETAASGQSMQKVISHIFTKNALDLLNLGM